MFIVESEGETMAFTGDFLFMSGTGKFFEGNAAQMASCIDSLNEYPADTMLFYGHEYGENNLIFTTWLDPDNQSAAKKLEEVADTLEKRESPLPGYL